MTTEADHKKEVDEDVELLQVAPDDPCLPLMMFFFFLLDQRHVHWGTVEEAIRDALKERTPGCTMSFLDSFLSRTALEMARRLTTPMLEIVQQPPEEVPGKEPGDAP